MVPNNNACLRAFSEGEKARDSYPLILGGYKLREAHHNLTRIRDTIGNIARYQRIRGGDIELFGCCTRTDAAYWLKRQPGEIAFDVAYNVVPAIEALAGDGVPESVVSACMANAAPRVQALLAQCDSARTTLRLGIKPEYRLMNSGGSTALPLVEAAIDLIEDTLATAGLQL